MGKENITQQFRYRKNKEKIKKIFLKKKTKINWWVESTKMFLQF